MIVVKTILVSATLRIIEPRCVRCDTVDGSEIRRSPAEVGSFTPLFTRFQKHPRWFFAGFLNHQQ